MPLGALAETPAAEAPVLAKVLSVRSQTIQTIPGTQTNETVQELSAQTLGGPDAGAYLTVENDYRILAVGDRFYAAQGPDGSWVVKDTYRLPVLELLAAVLVLVVLVFGGMQGIRGLLSLAASLAAIFWVLIPGILAGYSPVLLAIGVSALIICVGSYVTHGVSRTTTAAVIGMLITICITGALAYWSVYAGNLSGYASDEVTYLHIATNGGINLIGLLLGGIMIGVLGILYDAAIGQAVAVEELKRAGAHYGAWKLYRRAERIGREHIGALVNTLAIAYVGVSLPLLLLLHFSGLSASGAINQEVIAAELIRMMVGSIGLVLAVPITTLVSVWLLRNENPSAGRAEGKGNES